MAGRLLNKWRTVFEMTGVWWEKPARTVEKLRLVRYLDAMWVADAPLDSDSGVRMIASEQDDSGNKFVHVYSNHLTIA